MILGSFSFVVYYFRLLRKRNIRNMKRKINLFLKGEISQQRLLEIYQGWEAYAKCTDTYKLRKNSFNKIFSFTYFLLHK